MLGTYELNKLKKQLANHIEIKCEICGKEITEVDYLDIEYVKTKRKTEMYFHTSCFKNK